MLENKLKVLNAELNAVNDIADYYRSMRFNNTYFNYQTKTKNHNNHQILYAIKYAMKKSHQDNGGNKEDFKKFRELYNSMK